MSQHNATRTTPRTAAPPALGLALLVIAAAQLMLVLDDTIVNVALPSMQRSLHIATPHLNWVASFYALAFGGLLLAGRPRRRPVRPPADVPPRDHRVRAGLDGRRFRPGRDSAAGRPHRARMRRRDRRARRAVLAGHHLPRWACPDQGPRRLRRHGRARLGGRPAARRCADHLPELALGAVHQRPDRRRGVGRLRRPGRRRPRARHSRRARRDHCDPRHRLAYLRPHPRQHQRLDHPRHPRLFRNRGRAAAGLPGHRACQPRRRCYRPG